MTENEKINGWTFEETIKTAENLMETESNMFKWDVLRHLRDFVENFKDELEQYRAIGTIEELQALKEKSVAKKPIDISMVRDCEGYIGLVGKCPCCGEILEDDIVYCDCGQKLDWH